MSGLLSAWTPFVQRTPGRGTLGRCKELDCNLCRPAQADLLMGGEVFPDMAYRPEASVQQYLPRKLGVDVAAPAVRRAVVVDLKQRSGRVVVAPESSAPALRGERQRLPCCCSRCGATPAWSMTEFMITTGGRAPDVHLPLGTTARLLDIRLSPEGEGGALVR
jgi:hypothetical protein